VRLRRERLEVLFVVSGGHKRADLFQMCGLGMHLREGRTDARRPSSAVSSNAQSLGGRVDAPVLLEDTVRDGSVVSRHVSLCAFTSACRCRATP
jgi:hypothetical protein